MSHIHHECELERRIVEQLDAAGWLVGMAGMRVYPVQAKAVS